MKRPVPVSHPMWGSLKKEVVVEGKSVGQPALWSIGSRTRRSIDGLGLKFFAGTSSISDITGVILRSAGRWGTVGRQIASFCLRGM